MGCWTRPMVSFKFRAFERGLLNSNLGFSILFIRVRHSLCLLTTSSCENDFLGDWLSQQFFSVDLLQKAVCRSVTSSEPQDLGPNPSIFHCLCHFHHTHLFSQILYQFNVSCISTNVCIIQCIPYQDNDSFCSYDVGDRERLNGQMSNISLTLNTGSINRILLAIFFHAGK